MGIRESSCVPGGVNFRDISNEGSPDSLWTYGGLPLERVTRIFIKCYDL